MSFARCPCAVLCWYPGPGVHCYSVGDQNHVLTGYIHYLGGHGQEGQYQDQNPSCHDYC